MMGYRPRIMGEWSPIGVEGYGFERWCHSTAVIIGVPTWSIEVMA